MIQVSNLSKGYGDQVLFDEVSFAINDGERIGLVGRNGHGKSTLFRILSGVEEPDAGDIHIPVDYRIGYLSQELSFSEPTVLEEAALGLPLNEEGWKETFRAEAILSGLGFSAADMEKSPLAISGGFQVRLNLAKLLLSEPNLLLLDEPTNYLDILALRWLERFLRSWPKEVILITHDQEFMDKVSTHTLGIHRGNVRKIEGGTAKYYNQLETEEEVHEKSRVNQERKIKQTEDFIRRFRAKASKAKAVQSRVKALERMDTLEQLDDIDSLDFRFTHAPFPGKRLAEIDSAGFRYTTNTPFLFENLSFSVGPRDRIAVIGPNGRGKSTLLRMIAGELQPESGSVTLSPNLQPAYFGQTNVERLDRERTIEEELLEVTQNHNRTVARTIAGVMMFEGDAALKKISVLSGGERSRVLLGRLLLTPSNLLLLDEPSNHLDMYSNNALLEAVRDFEGAVIIVTHSEMFLDAIAERLIVFDGGRAEVFEGTYRDFLRRRGWQEEGGGGERQASGGPKRNKKELRRLKADLIQRRSAALSPLQKQTAQLERKITELEAETETTTEKLIESSRDGFGDEAAKLSRQAHNLKEETERCYEQLEALLAQTDALTAEFETELKLLEEV